MKRIEELNIIIDAKSKELAVVNKKIADLTSTYKEIMDQQISNHPLLKKWHVSDFHSETMYVAFQNGTYADGKTPKYEGFTIYYYEPYGDESRHLEMNTSCFGSFSIESEGRETTYYNGVGVFCSDKNLVNTIKTIWDAFLNEYVDVEKMKRKIEDALRTAQNEAHDIKDAEENAELYALQDDAIVKNPTGYIVCTLGESYDKVKHFTYRKRPVYWENAVVFADEHAATCEANRMNHKSYLKHKAIAVVNLKVA